MQHDTLSCYDSFVKLHSKYNFKVEKSRGWWSGWCSNYFVPWSLSICLVRQEKSTWTWTALDQHNYNLRKPQFPSERYFSGLPNRSLQNPTTPVQMYIDKSTRWRLGLQAFSPRLAFYVLHSQLDSHAFAMIHTKARSVEATILLPWMHCVGQGAYRLGYQARRREWVNRNENNPEYSANELFRLFMQLPIFSPPRIRILYLVLTRALRPPTSRKPTMGWQRNSTRTQTRIRQQRISSQTPNQPTSF